ncbi:SDR family oxidoreductase, partial [Candidatus Peregrinibacteria bacterium]|nr:SDR family oxidoreductase [Candidatus Peregrinibacteria bacterium]
MESKKLLVIGGGGYIGNHVVDEALRSGRKVAVLDIFYFGHDKLRRHADNPDLEIVTADIRTISIDVFKDVDEVISMAGISNDPSCDLLPEVTESTNLHGCIRVAKLAKEAGVKRFVDISSCSVYGRAEESICDEKSPTRPVSLYAR